MMDSANGEPATVQGTTSGEPAGAVMRRAREAMGLTLAEVALRTRVPLRHLEAIERADYGALPGLTYCAGFARAYARAVGLDEVALVAKVREEVEAAGDFATTYEIDEPADPARVPPRTLAWTAALIALVIVAGYAIWRMQLNAPPESVLGPVAEQNLASGSGPAVSEPATPPPASVPVAGPVVLSAADDVWMRIYDKSGKELFEGVLKRGEAFTVPANSDGPMILTGRADALAVTVGGQSVAPLGTGERTISDVPISAVALLARPVTPDADAAGTANPGNDTAAAGMPASGGSAATQR